ncbi:MAG: sigma 54-interacting transcriptional regulator, partial [Myxococcales bacterium]|nr:sigma 54-interacting transcriptional regulator [Myxococcales bacterium]
MDLLDVETLEAPGSGALRPVRPALGLTIAWHADPSRVGEVCSVLAATEVNRAAPEFRTALGRPTGPLADPYISRNGIEITPLKGGGARITQLGRAPLEVNGQPVEASVDVPGGQAVITLARRAVLVLGPIAVPRRGADHGLVGESEALQGVRRNIERAAGTEVPVLLRGPSGSGKELVARALHEASARKRGPYRTVNLAAVPESTAAAAFFGHTKGAFTGAAQAHPGYFGEADGGTL